MGRGGSVVRAPGGGSIEMTSVRDYLLPLRSFNFVHPILRVSFGRDTKTNGPFYLVSGAAKDPTQG